MRVMRAICLWARAREPDTNDSICHFGRAPGRRSILIAPAAGGGVARAMLLLDRVMAGAHRRDLSLDRPADSRHTRRGLSDCARARAVGTMRGRPIG